jgi:hypothetical protein
VEHPFRVIKRQFGFIKVRFKRAEEKHRATHHAVCVIESVDSSHEVDGSMGMSAPETRAKVKIGFLERMCKITKNLIKRQILLIEVSCSAYS